MHANANARAHCPPKHANTRARTDARARSHTLARVPPARIPRAAERRAAPRDAATERRVAPALTDWDVYVRRVRGARGEQRQRRRVAVALLRGAKRRRRRARRAPPRRRPFMTRTDASTDTRLRTHAHTHSHARTRADRRPHRQDAAGDRGRERPSAPLPVSVPLCARLTICVRV